MLEVALALAHVLELGGKRTESVKLYELAMDLVSEDKENHLAWTLYCEGANLEYAERLAYRALAKNSSMATLHTLFAIQARSGNWEIADDHIRRYIREEPIAKIISEWNQDILFFRDACKAGREQWVADRIASELPLPRDDRWEVIRLALTEQAVREHRLQGFVQIVREQLRSTEDNPKFPPIGKS
jgi:tetratricopeptide (TPR) repeat protein